MSALDEVPPLTAVTPDFGLADVDPSSTPGMPGKKAAEKELAETDLKFRPMREALR